MTGPDVVWADFEVFTDGTLVRGKSPLFDGVDRGAEEPSLK